MGLSKRIRFSMSSTSELSLPVGGQTKTQRAGNGFTLRYLESSESSIWDALVQSSPQGSVFCRSWWLRAVGDARVLGYFVGNDLVAGIPVIFEKRFGMTICTMPRLTPTWGVVMQPLPGKTATVLAREMKILRAFASELSKFTPFFQAFHPNLLNWLPFHWDGFRQTTRFTYVIDDLSDLRRVWDGVSSSTHGQIYKAQKAGLEFVPCGIDEVYRCEFQSHVRHGAPPHHSESILRRIYESARQNGCGACFAVIDRERQVHSAWCLVWDGQRGYNLVGGVDDDLRKSGANSFGVWKAIEFLSQRTSVFDFAGSMIEGVEKFNRGFGAKQVPYNYIMKAPALLHCALQLAGKI